METTNKNKIYLVKYYGGMGIDDYYNVTIFATTNKKTAKKYTERFNGILEKWKKHYEQFETTEFGVTWIADQHIEKHFDRWERLKDISNCYYEEVEVR